MPRKKPAEKSGPDSLEDINRVMTQYKTEVDVRNSEFGDETGSLCFAVWRQPLEVGQVVQVKCAILSQTSQGLPKITAGRHTQLEIMPKDLITEVTGFENKFQEDGVVVGFTSVNVYKTCTNAACYHKKLVNEMCATCQKKYSTEEQPYTSAVCNIMVTTEEDDVQELTVFDSQIKQLQQTPDIPETNEQFENTFTNLQQPIKVSFTPSPQNDKTVASCKLEN